MSRLPRREARLLSSRPTGPRGSSWPSLAGPSVPSRPTPRRRSSTAWSGCGGTKPRSCSSDALPVSAEDCLA
eukprot:scaffold604082_cov34-Prasinocladus_malaysianus.AAC.1